MQPIYFLIYAPFFNRILRYLIRALSFFVPSKYRLHPCGLMRLNVPSAEMTILIETNQTSYIGKQLFYDGAEQFEYTTIFLKLIKRVSCFIDVGANIGYYTILAGKCNADLQIYSFEPARGARTYLTANIKHNGLEGQVRQESMALSDNKGQLRFFEVQNPKYPHIPNLSGEHNLGTKNLESTVEIQVESLPLDDYVSLFSVDSIDLIKIDTEGSEHIVLKGAKGVLERNRPIVICETLFQKIEEELEAIFFDLDYLFLQHCPDGLRETKSLKRSLDDGVRNCFFVPREKRGLVADWIVV
ncbi:MAG: FkbM family methyltransferase [Flavobacteriaceae bacterium]|nr:FkbM family methyltransferase [Flavobacteriaceae bacterium]